MLVPGLVTALLCCSSYAYFVSYEPTAENMLCHAEPKWLCCQTLDNRMDPSPSRIGIGYDYLIFVVK